MASTYVTLEELEAAIRNLPDFPQEGIQFKDITPVLGNARLLDGSISHLLGEHTADTVDVVAGIDARGFIFGAAMARELGVGFVPIRRRESSRGRHTRRATSSSTAATPLRSTPTP